MFTKLSNWSEPVRHHGRRPAKNAVETASKSLKDLRVAEISKLDMKVEDGKVTAYRARVSLSFKYTAD